MEPLQVNQQKKVERLWHQIDASKLTLGRIATHIANLLRGKHKRNFLPHLDMGDYVVAINIDKLQFTGRKISQKKYYRHSGYLGGLKMTSLKSELNKNPNLILKRAVYNMLDDLKFRKKIISRLILIKGQTHQYKIHKVW